MLALLPAVSTASAEAQVVVVDHTSVALFEQIPAEYLNAAANLTMVFADRSVGSNIDDGLTCLGYPSVDEAPTSCKRYTHVVPEFSSPASEVYWSRTGGYNRSNWTYHNFPGGGLPDGAVPLPCSISNPSAWYEKLECFIQYVDANPTAYRVYSYQNSYLEVDSSSDIASSTRGYFVNQASRFDIADFEALQARHPAAIFLHHTSSLARAVGSQVAADFNGQMRAYVRSHGGYLLDVADIESHDPWGRPCYDNRDGVPYTVQGVLRENHPDDGLSLPAVCQHYTPEAEGGHLGSPDVGKIRVAKAFWVLMARIAGWNPDGQVGTPTAPTNLRIIR